MGCMPRAHLRDRCYQMRAVRRDDEGDRYDHGGRRARALAQACRARGGPSQDEAGSRAARVVGRGRFSGGSGDGRLGREGFAAGRRLGRALDGVHPVLCKHGVAPIESGRSREKSTQFAGLTAVRSRATLVSVERTQEKRNSNFLQVLQVFLQVFRRRWRGNNPPRGRRFGQQNQLFPAP
jgi:hypothetical protein